MKKAKKSWYTAYMPQIDARIAATGEKFAAVMESILAEKFDPASSAPETLTPGQCCIECSQPKCGPDNCWNSPVAIPKEEAMKRGLCEKCDECPDWTAAKPKEEK